MNIRERFKDAAWYDPENPVEVTLGGCGGIGSYFSIFAYKLGWNVFAYEDSANTIEETNIGGQLFGESSLRQRKTEAIENLIINLGLQNNNQFVDMGTMFHEGYHTLPISVAAFDNMEARKNMYESWKRDVKNKKEDEVGLFIDPRMSAEQGIIYAIRNPSQIKRYESELFTDEEADELACSYKATPHCGALIAIQCISLICNQIYNKKVAPMREVPFKINVDLRDRIRYEE